MKVTCILKIEYPLSVDLEQRVPLDTRAQSEKSVFKTQAMA